MSLPRMREEQVAELNRSTQQIIRDAKIPKFCSEKCREFNPTCAAAWILETVSEASRMEEYQETDNELQVRRLNSEIRLIPDLYERAKECKRHIESKAIPLGVDVVELVIKLRFSNLADAD